MAQQGTFQGNLAFANGKELQVNLPFLAFEEDGVTIIYCPSLELNGYGKTEAEAFDSLKITLAEYFEYCLNKGTLWDDLKAHGWKLKKKKTMTPPDLSHLLRDNALFADVFNTKDYRKFNQVVTVPAFA